MPVMDPVPAFSDTPGGKLPEEMLKTYGADPPLTAITALYGDPTVVSPARVETLSCALLDEVELVLLADCETPPHAVIRLARHSRSKIAKEFEVWPLSAR